MKKVLDFNANDNNKEKQILFNETVKKLPITDIDDFKEHPFKVLDNKDMMELVESIKSEGLLEPLLVRKNEKDRYEIISGHRRKRALEKIGMKSIPCIIKEVTEDEAICMMVDSNLKREKILPSEKAFAYKMKLEALKNQGKRCDLTSVPVAQKLGKTAREVIGKQIGVSADQIRRYIRLTKLIPDILNLVDEERIAFRPAVELSYLNEEQQKLIYDLYKEQGVTPSLSQSIRMKELNKIGKLYLEKICSILEEEKPNQKEKYKINYDRFEKIIPKQYVTDKQIEDFLFLCAKEHYIRQKRKERER